MDVLTDRRRVFLRLSEKEKFEALFNMLMDEIAERVKLQARVVTLQNENESMRTELDGIAHRKVQTLDVMNTSDKIRAELDKRSGAWVWYRDRVLPGTLTAIQTLIIMAVLYLAFKGGTP